MHFVTEKIVSRFERLISIYLTFQKIVLYFVLGFWCKAVDKNQLIQMLCNDCKRSKVYAMSIRYEINVHITYSV